MTESTFNLDVFLRGDRDYVQGTQIVSRVAELLGDGEWILDAAQFTRLSTRMLLADDSSAAAMAGVIARVQFADPTGKNRSFALTEGAEPAPRRAQPMPIAVTRQSERSGTDKAIWDYSGVSGFEDMANVIVQAIKAEHGERWPGCHDVWLTGFRRLGLPVAGRFPDAGRIALTLYRQLGEHGLFQTIWQVALPDIGLEGMVTFAFRAPGAGDGH